MKDSILVVYDSVLNLAVERRRFYQTVNRVNDACIEYACGVLIDILIPSAALESFEREYGEISADNIYVLQTEGLNKQPLICYMEQIYKFCEKNPYMYIFFPSSIWGRSISAWLGGKFETGVTADVVELLYQSNEKDFLFVRATAENELLSQIRCDKNPKIASVRGKKEQKDKKRQPQYIKLDNPMIYAQNNIHVLNREIYNLEIKDSRVVIGIGRGLNDEEISYIKEFAKLYGIPIVGSKPLVELGVLSKDKQVGQSGKFIDCDLYIAVGISGAPQHIVGILECKKIVAINPDAYAPIHQYADISIIKSAKTVFGEMLSMKLGVI